MRFGILADIHGHVDKLRQAVSALRRERVDQFIVLGDLIFSSQNATETVDILAECGAIGVWGNHELALCVEPDDEIRAMYTPAVLDYFGTLTQRLELGDVLLSHTLPTSDPTDPMAYYLHPDPRLAETRDECFRQCSQRTMIIGHFHKWFAATSVGQLAWEGREPLVLNPETRYFIICHAVMFDWTAVYDDQTQTLFPIHLERAYQTDSPSQEP